ncbi:MAG: hypothetical protein IJS83_04975 [Acholeplasmatales bacterium]|nr:hypothetical protein [Acholeplasmatales bacterium]
MEVLVTKFGGIMLGTPTITISFLIIILAVIRWNLWGLILIPLLALATVLGGNWSDIGQYKAFYSFGNEYNNCGLAVYVSTMCGLLAIGLNVIPFKKFTTRKILKNPFLIIGIIFADYLLFNVIQLIIFRLMTAGSPLQRAEIMYTGNTGSTFNVASYGDEGFIRNLLALAIAVVGILILRSQGVATNVVEKLIDDKKNAELDAQDRKFRIEELEEEKEMEDENSSESSDDAKSESDEDTLKKQI